MRRVAVAAVALAGLSFAAANPAHRQISSMDEAGRAGFFSKYLSSNGERCPSVTRTFYQGSDSRGAAFWSVQCSGGKAFQLMINNDAGGSAKLLDCDFVKAINAGTCFKRF